MINTIKEWWKRYFWMTCSGCNKLMNNYTMQALVRTKEGVRDKYYCKQCTIKIRGNRLVEPLK